MESRWEEKSKTFIPENLCNMCEMHMFIFWKENWNRVKTIEETVVLIPLREMRESLTRNNVKIQEPSGDLILSMRVKTKLKP